MHCMMVKIHIHNYIHLITECMHESSLASLVSIDSYALYCVQQQVQEH